ncbi:hypothetical protein [Enterococcus wangshanyuanii]|uniref:Uncharacterized protein n=2 Tax=Enterococcus TaxID=1350 RepID=A0ABQ1PI73_9ENTE|nr:hypothetical protein [Enterococcus wangshanyuanii]GGC97758.1 hypothetical protein GCM10011573_29090 [Enterococcus wangshanyuanii]
MGTILKLNEYRLLQHSSIFDKDRDHWILEILNEKRNLALNKKILEKRGFSNDDIEFIKSNKDIWLQEARNQWKQVDVFKKTDKIPCDLCNKKHHIMCIAENKKTKKIINVGTTCIDTLGDEISRSSKKLVTNNRERWNLEEIQHIFPGIRKKIDFWKDFLQQTPLIIPFYLSKKYTLLGVKIKQTFEKAVKSNNLIPHIAELHQLFAQEKRIKNSIDRYCNMHMDTDFIYTREIYNDLAIKQTNALNEINEIICSKKVATIDWKSAHRINTIMFLEKFANCFNNSVQVLKIVDVKRGKFIIQFTHLQDVLFSMSSTIFIQNLGDAIFLNTDLSNVLNERINDCLSNLSLLQTSSEENNILTLIHSIIRKKLNMERYFPEKDSELNNSIKNQIKRLERKMTSKEKIDELERLISINWSSIARYNNNISIRYKLFSRGEYPDFLFYIPLKYAIPNIRKLYKTRNDNLSKFEEIIENYVFLGHKQIAKAISDIIKDENYSNSITLRNELNRILRLKYFDEDKYFWELHNLKDKIIDYRKYKHPYIDYYNSSTNNIHRITKEEFLEYGKNILLFSGKNRNLEIQKLIDRILYGKTQTKEDYRKDAMVSVAASELS